MTDLNCTVKKELGKSIIKIQLKKKIQYSSSKTRSIKKGPLYWGICELERVFWMVEASGLRLPINETGKSISNKRKQHMQKRASGERMKCLEPVLVVV